MTTNLNTHHEGASNTMPLSVREGSLLEVANDTEPFTQKLVSTFPKNDLIRLPLIDNVQQLVTVDCEQLCLHIRACLADGSSIFEITVTVQLRDGSSAQIVLTKDV
jgi:hypothetical protein